MKRSNILLATSIAVTAVAGAGVVYSKIKDHEAHVVHVANVASQVRAFKACPEAFRARRSCHSEQEKVRLQAEAGAAREQGRWEEAALKFIEIGMENDAKEMIGRLGGRQAGRLRDLLAIRQEALDAIRQDEERGIPFARGIGPVSSAPIQPVPGSSAQPAASSSAQPGSGTVSEADAGAAVSSDGGAPAASAAGQGTAAAGAPAYTTSSNPFDLGTQLSGILAEANSGDAQAKVNAIFERLHRGGANGVTVADMTGLAPRTASEAFAQGGDCTDLAVIVIALLRQAGIPGGALVLHFNNAPQNEDHMVPFVEIGGRRVIIDLQASRLGQTAAGEYIELLTLTYDQAAFMYHREMGVYFADHNQRDQAVAAFRRAIEIFDGDAFTHQNLGILLEQSRDMQGAQREFRRATELDPRYAGDQARGTYNEELQAGEREFRARHWRLAEGHFMNALTSGEPLSDSDRRTIQRNIETCRRNASRTRK